LTGEFRDTEDLGFYAGHGPKGIGAICDPTAFSGVVSLRSRPACWGRPMAGSRLTSSRLATSHSSSIGSGLSISRFFVTLFLGS
jgi:hypothetical protein